jgi:serine/threonine protein kinase
MLDHGSALTVGRIVPDYELLRRIGRGSYGEVWLARSKATGVLRAAKIVWRHTFEDERPFQREFEGIQRFERISREHPSQLSLFHIGRNEPEGYFYYVMELADDVQGQNGIDCYSPRTLRSELQHGRLASERVIEIALLLTEALFHLHGNGLVHRDVKPSNVIFVNGRPKLADIGLVTDASDAHSIVGTEGYLPPEGPGTPHADIFALGKVLYEAATGLDRRQFPKLPPDLRGWPEASQVLELNEILLKACATDPRQRYSGAESMLGELELLRNGKSVKRKRVWNRRWAFGRKAGAVGLVLVAILATAIPFLKKPPGRDQRSAIPEVNDLVDQGNYIGRAAVPDRLRQALTDYKKAVQLDPTSVPAQFGLFMVYMDFGAMETDASADLKREFRAAAARLMEIAPSCAESHAAAAATKWMDWHFRDAQNEARLSTQLPAASKEGVPQAHLTYGFQLLQTGNPSDALREYQAAEQADPSRPGAHFCIGLPYFVWRRFDEALKYFQDAIDLEPRLFPAYLMRGQVFEAKGDFISAINEFEQHALIGGENEAATRLYYNTLREAVRKGGAKGYWEKSLELALKTTPQDVYRIATLYASLGDKNTAYAWLRKACEKKAFDQDLMVDLCWDHNDPEFQKIARGIGLLQ